MTMHIKVRLQGKGVLMTVTGAKHCVDFTEPFDNHADVWAAARKVSEAEQDHRVANGPGWK